MKTKQTTRDKRECRAERQEKLGTACDSLPAKTLAEQTGAARQTKAMSEIRAKLSR
jgi:hypothetical protein